MGFISKDDFFGDDRFLVKDKTAVEGLTFDHLREPVLIVFPHFVIGNVFDVCPEGIGFPCCCRGSGKIVCNEYVAMNARDMIHVKP